VVEIGQQTDHFAEVNENGQVYDIATNSRRLRKKYVESQSFFSIGKKL